jgi:hypothetical protein
VKVRVTHGGPCSHDAESWNLAFSAALSCSGKTVNPQSRMPTIRALMREGAKGIWHQGVHFVGRVIG